VEINAVKACQSCKGPLYFFEGHECTTVFKGMVVIVEDQLHRAGLELCKMTLSTKSGIVTRRPMSRENALAGLNAIPLAMMRRTF
jgi:hypothetical protein